MSVTYRFDRFELDVDELELWRDGKLVPLQDLPLRLLAALVERAPATVPRETLREMLWPPGTHLDVDASLNTAVARVREALGDDASSPRFIATVPRRGYRFVAPVESIEPSGTGGGAGRSRSPARRGVVAVAALLGAVAMAAGLWWSATGPAGSSGGGGRRGSPGPPAEARKAEVREYLLVGRHHLDRRTRDGLEKAIATFQSAAALDPESAEAYSGLAAAYSLLGIYDDWRPREAFGPAETMARRALELDPDSARAQLAQALVAAVAHWDWDRALSAIDRAVELAPDAPEPLLWRGALLSSLGRHGEALASTERALALDPTSPVAGTALSWYLFQARRWDEAVTQAHRAIELHPGYYDAWDNLKWIEITRGDEAAALEAWARSEELGGGDGEEIRRIHSEGGLELLHRSSIASQMARWRSGSYQSPYDIVLEHTALGRVDEALVWLERSFTERETDLVGLAVDPRLDALRDEPRFQALVARMDFPASP